MFSLFEQQIYPKETIGISPKTHLPLPGNKSNEFKRIHSVVFLYCSTRTLKSTVWALKPKAITAVAPKLVNMILFAIIYNLQAI